MEELRREDYERLRTLFKKQEEEATREEKIAILSMYFVQADRLIAMMEQLPSEYFQSLTLMTEFLAEASLELDSYNDEIYPVMLKSDQNLVELAFEHIILFGLVAGFVMKPSQAVIERTVLSLEKPIPETAFKLSESIWGSEKRIGIYKHVLEGIQAGVPRQQLINTLHDHLKKSGQGGAYYKAERVVDNELRRAYHRSKLDSIREFNKQRGEGDKKLMVELKLSSAHVAYDMCDEAAGFYDPDGGVPDLPLHPNCRCYLEEAFMEDQEVKSYGSKGEVYTSAEFGTRAMLY